MILVFLCFIEGLYNHFSTRNQVESVLIVIQMYQKKGDPAKIFEQHTLNGFYFIVITLIQIGNMDPGLSNYKEDYLLLSICMMVGIVLFNYTHASLTSYIGSLIVQAQTVQSYRN
jgi:hypothetical protein